MFFKFVVCLCIILFLADSSALGQAQPRKYGEIWSQLSNKERDLYLAGFTEGTDSFLVTSMLAMANCQCEKPKETGFNRIQHAFQSSRIEFDLGVLGKVMTDIYKDPANVFIPFSQVVHLAVDKLSGKNIENDIIKMRKAVIDVYDQYRKKN